MLEHYQYHHYSHLLVLLTDFAMAWKTSNVKTLPVPTLFMYPSSTHRLCYGLQMLKHYQYQHCSHLLVLLTDFAMAWKTLVKPT